MRAEAVLKQRKPDKRPEEILDVKQIGFSLRDRGACEGGSGTKYGKKGRKQ